MSLKHACAGTAWAAAAIFFTAELGGCGQAVPPPTPLGVLTSPATTSQPTGTAQQAPGYSRLLIQPGDIGGSVDTYALRSSTENPQGTDGVTALFINQDDTRAISVTIVVLPDPAAATAVLHATADSIATQVVGGRAQTATVGAGSTEVSGISTDRSKALTALVFMEGRAVVRLEFGSLPGDPAPREMVADVATKQNIAVRSGLSGTTS
ncbi:hypothetical protein [Mycolicibacterium fortuitum]|uniref:hypothetical protein n=1 Tax=Mycolicibacterium fortuitum TaxID=1766 RepID=UPI001CE0C7C5|nr:hypothetical protein [Mycolicibacterium fortuitum]MCA4726598.1 hypothetical protein [Mycolicibacterium fortuitum]